MALNRRGAAVATILALLGTGFTWLRSCWEPNQSMLFNLLAILKPLPNVEAIAQRSTSEQVSILDSMAREAENIPEVLIPIIFGEHIAAASVGPIQTPVQELHFPSRDVNRTIPALCTRPHLVETGSKLPLVIYFHYGGFVTGSSKSELVSVRYIASVTNAIVCSIDYRKAPDFPYPAAINDVFDASLDLILEGGESRDMVMDSLDVTVDPAAIATFGTSAGGYLAAQASRFLATKGISVKVQVSIAPMVKPHGGTESMLRYGQRDYWNKAWNTYAWTKYLSGDDGTLVNDWTVNLLVDPPGDDVMERLPLVYLQVNTKDVLYDEGKMYAKHLTAHDKLLEIAEYETNHMGGNIPLTRGGPAKGAFERAVRVLKHEFYANAGETNSGTATVK